MQITRFILLLFCSLAVNVSSAQDGGETDLGSGSYRNNFQIWPGVKLSHTFKKDWTVSAQYLLRADITNQNIDGHYISIGAKYRILKYLIADAGFRFVTSAQSNNAYRFETGLRPRYKYKDFTFSYRLGYFFQTEYFALSRYERGHKPVHYLRNKIEINWNFKPNWDVYVSSEAYTLLTVSYALTRKISCIAGFSYEFAKGHSLDVYYRAQPDVYQKKADMLHAIGILYSWDIPKKFKKKKKK